MSRYYGTDEIMASLDALIVGDDITSEEVELFEQASKRLEIKDRHIELLQARLRVAESTLGQMYVTELMEQELD